MKYATDAKPAASPEAEEAAETFVRRSHGEWSAADQAQHESRLASDAAFAKAFAGVERSWRSVPAHAESAEMMRLRENAIAWIRRENMLRWKGGSQRRRGWAIAASLAGMAVAAALGFQFWSYSHNRDVYSTGIGQQQTINLADRSHVALDAVTQLRIEYTDTARKVHLIEGQAQFSVAKDSRRPFTVHAGDRTIVALGTVFTVEYIDRKVRVATLEGKVATDSGVSIVAGEELRIGKDGKTVVTPKADMAAATAWMKGSVIFRDEPLGDAVLRMNRYSRLQLEISDPELAALRVSGVFELGDAGSFARSVQNYYPVVADYSDPQRVSLRLK